MSDVFISYARHDIEQAERLAKALESQGYSVWWDYQINAGQNFRTTIHKALAASKAVIVIWSKNSVDSHWVIEEASYARDAGKLVAVHLPDFPKAMLPFGFTQIHTASVDDHTRLHRALDSLGCPKATSTQRLPRRRPGPDDPVTNTDIFISFVESDLPVASRLAKGLSDIGFSVWWDPEAYISSEFDDTAFEALDRSDVAVALWSRKSITSKAVRDEAIRAVNDGKLISVAIPPVTFEEFPMGLARCPKVDLNDSPALLKAITTLLSAH